MTEIKSDDTQHKLPIFEISIWCALILVGIGLVIYFIAFATTGRCVEVKVDGKVVGYYDMKQDGVHTITGYDGGTNTITIKDGEVCVSEADCPDKLCQEQGHIYKMGQSIICLPNRVVITLVDKQPNDAEIDGVAE